MAIINLDKVSKFYAGEHTVSMGLSRVDLSVEMGEFVVITGESGSGKSTLLNIISGLDTYDEGVMTVASEDTTGYTIDDYENYRKKYVTNIFQDFYLVGSYTVYQNIELAFLLNGGETCGYDERIKELIQFVGLQDFANTKVSKLSGGQKQRVAIARAMAKDAPILVADEPTGNLDTASAASVLEILSKVASTKLVIIVTHNYEQVEKYATRKITMSDGKIVGDERLQDKYLLQESTQETSDQSKETTSSKSAILNYLRSLTDKSAIKLGVRNAFNLPVKLVLLSLVFCFTVVAVISLFASSKDTENLSSALGWSQYFNNISPKRIILTKPDKSAFTDEEIKEIANLDNIEQIFENDVALDLIGNLSINNLWVDGALVSIDNLEIKKPSYGRMPSAPNEVLIRADKISSSYVQLDNSREDILEQSSYLSDNMTAENLIEDKVKVTGLILEDDDKTSQMFGASCYSRIYLTPELMETVLARNAAGSAMAELYIGEHMIEGQTASLVKPCKNVPRGEAYLREDAEYHFKDFNAINQNVRLKTKSQYFDSEYQARVTTILTQKNFASKTGFAKDLYEEDYAPLYINEQDYYQTFNKGNFQISVFMKDYRLDKSTLKALNNAGYNTLLVKDTLSDLFDNFSSIIAKIAVIITIFVYIVLFVVIYLVIKLIMKSRSSYYGVMRILGAEKSKVRAVFTIELLTIMFIIFTFKMILALLIKSGLIGLETLQSYLYFLKPWNILLILLILVILTMIMAGRYSSSMFKRTAIITAREGSSK